MIAGSKPNPKKSMSKKNAPEFATTEALEKVLSYAMATDARFIALQVAITDALKYNQKQKDAFYADVEQRYKAIFQAMLEKGEDIDPALGARLLGETFPPSNEK